MEKICNDNTFQNTPGQSCFSALVSSAETKKRQDCFGGLRNYLQIWVHRKGPQLILCHNDKQIPPKKFGQFFAIVYRK